MRLGRRAVTIVLYSCLSAPVASAMLRSVAAAVAPLELTGSGSEHPGRVDIYLATADLVVGDFRCRDDDELCRYTNNIGDLAHVVWPWTPVEIDRSGFGRVCADANTVVLYGPRTEYRRRPLEHAGDRSLFVAMSPSLQEEVVSPALRRGGSFAVGHVTCPPAAWLHKEWLSYGRGRGHDPMRLELLAFRALAAALADPSAGDGALSVLAKERVEAARFLLGQDLASVLSIASVAAQLDVSPFHLARQFRAHTGTSMYSYRQSLRLRRALRCALRDDEADLSTIAADHGFSSHSHFTASCRRLFGRTPTSLRAAARNAH